MSSDRRDKAEPGSDGKGPQHVLRSLQIVNPQGLHARPAAEFVKLATRFTSDIHVRVRDSRVNGKSIMGLMMLEAYQGSAIVLEAFGKDAQAAIDCLADLVQQGFHEC